MTGPQSALRQPASLPPSTRVELRVGAYQPCYEIGSGGMASVYIAKEIGLSGLQRTVALKVMHEHLARQDQFRKRFLDEARVLTHIAHPFVCRVLGFGEEAQRPYMAMEYLVGEPLSRVLRAMKRRQNDLSTASRARLFARAIADLAEGLHAAHETRDHQGTLLGVVHRDVTPQNLFVLYDGTVRVLDFGIARYRDRDAHTANTGDLLGKLPYMAPEQVMGNPYDRRVDIWALGVVLWELVTLRRLFKRDSEMQTMLAISSERIPAVGEHVSGVPAGLQEILTHALERDPARRFQTARELSRALELWLARGGDPVTHADLSDFLNGFFPGSEEERRRWAEEATPGSGVRATQARENDDIETAAIELNTLSNSRSNAEDNAPLSAEPRAEEPEEVTTEIATVLVQEPIPSTLDQEPESDGFERSYPEPSTSGVKIKAPAAGRPDRVGLKGQAAALSLVALSLLLGFTWLATRLTTTTTDRAEVRMFGSATSASRTALVTTLELPSFAITDLPPPSTPAATQRPSVAPPAVRSEPTPAAAQEEALQGTGDVLVVSGKPGMSVRIYLGNRLLGTTPVRARLPAGAAALSVQLAEGGARVPMSTQVVAGRVNMLTVNLGE